MKRMLPDMPYGVQRLALPAVDQMPASPRMTLFEATWMERVDRHVRGNDRHDALPSTLSLSHVGQPHA